jgi:hypothetical protein
MFGCCTNSKLVAVTALPFHYTSQGIVLRSSFAFIAQKLLNLFMVRVEKGAIQINKSPRFTGALLLTRGANRLLWRPPVFVPFIFGG